MTYIEIKPMTENVISLVCFESSAIHGVRRRPKKISARCVNVLFKNQLPAYLNLPDATMPTIVRRAVGPVTPPVAPIALCVKSQGCYARATGNLLVKFDFLMTEESPFESGNF